MILSYIFVMFRFKYISKNINNIRFIRRMCEMRQMKVRCTEDENFLDITFRFSNDMLPEKLFQFHRSKDEMLGSFFTRLTNRINSAVTKRKKRLKQDAKFDIDLSPKMTYHDKVLDKDTKNVDAFKEGAIVSIDNISYKIEVNVPCVLALKLPMVIMIGYPVIPIFHLEFANKQDSQFVWYKSLTSEEILKYKEENPEIELLITKYGSWLEIGRGFVYIPTVNDIDKHLLIVCLPKYGVRSGCEKKEISSTVVTASPGRCPFEDRHLYTQKSTPIESFRCVSYNILADIYADSDFSRGVLFPYCPAYALSMDYRKQLLLKEISGYNADIICLQEVDNKIFKEFSSYFKETKYEGVFTQKGEKVREGLSIFYNTSKFRFIDTQSICLSKALSSDLNFIDIYSKIITNEKLTERLIARNTVLQTVLLESIDKPEKRLLVGNTHLYFQVDADHIRLLQAVICLKFLEYQLRKYAENSSSVPSVVFSGDFNSCPEFAVYELATKGHVSSESSDWKSTYNLLLSIRAATKLSAATIYKQTWLSFEDELLVQLCFQ